jgi:uncharacterized protein involved in exopolysaccharide biosynthesis
MSRDYQLEIKVTEGWLKTFEEQVERLQALKRGIIEEIQLDAAQSQVEDFKDQLRELRARAAAEERKRARGAARARKGGSGSRGSGL